MNKLEACLHCAKHNCGFYTVTLSMSENPNDPRTMKRYGVECYTPLCGGRVFLGLYGFENEKQAAKAWNTRRGIKQDDKPLYIELRKDKSIENLSKS